MNPHDTFLAALQTTIATDCGLGEWDKVAVLQAWLFVQLKALSEDEMERLGEKAVRLACGMSEQGRMR